MTASAVSTAPFIHPEALCESPHVGDGTRVWAFAHILKGAVVGCDCNIGDHAFVEGGALIGDRVTIKNGVLIWDGVVIEDDAFIGPGVVFTNDLYPRSPRMPEVGNRYSCPENWRVPTRVCRGASIGAGAVIVCGVTIGSFATVGAGTVVTRSVPAHRLLVGNPPRLAGWMCRCGMRLDESLSCRQCGRRFVVHENTLEEAD